MCLSRLSDNWNSTVRSRFGTVVRITSKFIVRCHHNNNFKLQDKLLVTATLPYSKYGTKSNVELRTDD